MEQKMEDPRKKFEGGNANKALSAVSLIVQTSSEFALHPNNLNVETLDFTCIVIFRNVFVYKNPKQALSPVFYYVVPAN